MDAQEEDHPLIAVEQDARRPLRRLLRERDQRFVVLCDANVASYAQTLTDGVKGRIALLPFDLGERRKNLRTLEAVLAALLAAGADRSTLLVGMGGGVASDLFGFAASVFMRGAPYVHVATSLVAMVDAAIGGKNGVDLRAGKNLAGVFREPLAVFAHVEALQTLPYRHLREGLAEMLKHAIIAGGQTFESLETLAPHAFWRWPWADLIADSAGVKEAIVRDDPREQGLRETLNLGHTFAHAIERASSYRVSHGAAVALGLRAAGLLAVRTGRFSQTEHLRVLALLVLLGMPLRTRLSAQSIRAAMNADKKRRAGRLRFVLPRAIGEVVYGIEVDERDVRAVLERLREPVAGSEFT